MPDSSPTLKLYLTVDTEIWCDGWNNIDEKFPAAFKKYIYGNTRHGEFGLPFQLNMLKEYGLKAVFFIEPLFATRFGLQPLQEIVGLVQEYGQNIELHLHTEWIDEAKPPIFPHVKEKREHIKYFSLQEQCELIALGKDLLQQAGINNIHAFRAGTFGANDETLHALSKNNILYDSSYNFCMDQCDISVFNDIQQPVRHNGIVEFPMSTFIDGSKRRRHAQLTACSFTELKSSLIQAHNNSWQSFVLLSHSFELLNADFNNCDRVVVKRFEKLCSFLAENSNIIKTASFDKAEETAATNLLTYKPLQLGLMPTAHRYYEQSLRRLF